MGKYKKIIVSIIILFAILLFNQSAYAMSQEDAGKALADFSIYFYKHYGSKTRYDVDGRYKTYTGATVGEYYLFDCVGWVSFATHQALGIGNEAFTEFAIPPYNNAPGFFNGIELVEGNVNDGVTIPASEIRNKAKPGDYLLKKRTTCTFICR